LKKKFAYWGLIDPLQLPGADLSAEITASPNPVLSGGTTAYTITVRNNVDHDTEPFQPSDDDLPAANVSLLTAVPAGTSFQSLTTPDGWTCNTPAVGTSGQVQCTKPTLAPGVAAQFVLTVALDCATSNGVQIANGATVSSTTADPNLTPNNTASVVVAVSNPAPVIANLAVDRSLLSPPNHKMVEVKLNYSIEDNCDTNLVPVITISSNQPPNGAGDGNTPVDWEVVDAHHVRLRAERSPHDSGTRIYTILVTVTDSSGGSSSSSVNVVVPR
jgi:hypothetical protein